MAKREGPNAERYLPLIYFIAALALIVVVLPTVLRPPQQQPDQSAELSPDTKPDADQQSIISSLERGQSATAGTDAAVGTGDAAGAGAAAGTGPGGGGQAQPAKPSFCPQGFGEPRRQTE